LWRVLLEFFLLQLLSLLDGGLVGLRNVVNELASHAVGTVSIGTVLLAEFCFVEHGDVSLDHHRSFSMSEGALKEQNKDRQ